MFYRYSLLLLTILLPSVTSASIFCEEIWSDWTDAGDVQPGGPDHKLICGMGPSTQLIHVGDALCFFPDTPCCAPYVIQMNATQGVYTCQLADSPTPTPANRSGSTTPFPIGKTSMFPNTAPPSTSPTITTAYNGGTSAPCIDNDPRKFVRCLITGFGESMAAKLQLS
ncbi:unnamed protein product, partial [Mesorhabditis belari]|uniref:Secreted protein n=1 Tax=Mesorhabditis belari TaxID=2138241 RepID=A0AAF3FL46_9BILA